MGDPSYARRCSPCDISYPDESTYKVCQACGNKTWRAKHESWDSDWPDRVRWNMEANSLRIPNVEVKIIRYKNLSWVAETILEAHGYVCDDFVIVKINRKFYELCGRKDGEIGAWWIERVKFNWPENIPVLSELEYLELDRQRGLRV